MAQAKFTLKADDKTKVAFLSVQKNLKGIAKKLGGVQARIAGVVGVAGFGALVKSSIDLADRTGKVSEKLGVTTDALSRLQFAVSQTSEVTEGQFNTALQRMVRRLEDASNKGGPLVEQLGSIGLNVENLAAMKPDEAFLNIADAMERTEDQGLKVKTAFALFDTEGVNLVNTLQKGREELSGLGDEAESLGIVISDKAAKQAALFNDNMDVLKKSASGLGVSLASDLLPSMINVTEAMREGAKEGGLFDAVLAGLNATIAQLINDSEIDEINNQIEIAEKQLLSTRERIEAATGGRGILAQGLEGSDPEKLISLVNDVDKITASLERLNLKKFQLLEGGGLGGDEADEENEKNIFTGKTDEETQNDADNLFFLSQQVVSSFKGFEELKTKFAEEESNKRRQLQQLELRTTASVFGSLANLSEAFGKKNSTRTKRFAQASAIANTWAGAARALHDVPYPFNIAAAAAVVANGLAMVKNIESGSTGGGGGSGIGGASIGAGDPGLGEPTAAPPTQQISTNVLILPGAGVSKEQIPGLLNDMRDVMRDQDIPILPEDGADMANIELKVL